MNTTIRCVIDRVDRAKARAARYASADTQFDYVNELAAAYPHLKAELERLLAIESRYVRLTASMRYNDQEVAA